MAAPPARKIVFAMSIDYTFSITMRDNSYSHTDLNRRSTHHRYTVESLYLASNKLWAQER